MVSGLQFPGRQVGKQEGRGPHTHPGLLGGSSIAHLYAWHWPAPKSAAMKGAPAGATPHPGCWVQPQLAKSRCLPSCAANRVGKTVSGADSSGEEDCVPGLPPPSLGEPETCPLLPLCSPWAGSCPQWLPLDSHSILRSPLFLSCLTFSPSCSQNEPMREP